jgi:hypothetical protein
VGCRGAGEGRPGGYGELSRSGDKGARLAGDARERGPRRGRKREKGSGRLEALSRSGGERRRGRREPGEGAGERKGKADGWVPPVSYPGWKGGGASRRVAKLGWAGLRGLARVRGRKGEGKERLGSGSVGRWTGGLLGVLGVKDWT